MINAQLAGSSGGPAVNVGASVGGNGGSGGNAGNVTVINSGSINTGTLFSGDGTVYGDFAYGLFAQSVGGGGGAGGSTINGQLGGSSKTAVNAGISIGGSGAAGGSAGTVAVTNTADSIRTYGDHASGIVAQSIGGGGAAVAAPSTSRPLEVPVSP